MTARSTDTAVAERLTVAPAQMRLHFRNVPVRGRESWDPVRTSRSGRWASSGTLYTTLEPETCLAEYCRWRATEISQADPTNGAGIDERNLWTLARLEVPAPLPARCIIELEARFRRMVDVGRADNLAVLEELGFSQSDMSGDNYAPCNRVAAAMEAAGIEAILSPSAAWPFGGAHCVSILPAGMSRIVGSPRVRHDAVRPTILIAYGTRYKAGERPAWLGAAA